MHHGIRALVLAALFAVCASTTGATEYYVDVLHAENDDGDGLTVATAKQTIQAAVDLATADGDVVYLLPGEYNQVFINTNPGLTIKGLGEAFIRRLASELSETNGTIDTVTFRYGTAGLRARDGATVVNCRFISNGTGLVINDPVIQNLTVNDCLFTGHSNQGIYRPSGEGVPTIVNCTFYQNNTGLALGDAGTVRNCTFVAHSSTAFTATGPLQAQNCHFYQNSRNVWNVTVVDGFSGDPLFIDPDNGVFMLQPDSPLLTSGLEGRRIGAFGQGFYGSRSQTPPWDGWVDADGQPLSASSYVLLNPDNEVILQPGVTAAALYSPVYDTGSQWTVIRSVDCSVYESLIEEAGHRQIIDFDELTPEREIRIRTAPISFAQDPSAGPAFDTVYKHEKFEFRAQYVQLELVLRNNGL